MATEKKDRLSRFRLRQQTGNSRFLKALGKV